MKSNTYQALGSMVAQPQCVNQLPFETIQSLVENPIRELNNLTNAEYLFATVETEESTLKLTGPDMYERCGIRKQDVEIIDEMIKTHGISISRNFYILGKFPCFHFSVDGLDFFEIDKIVRQIKIGNFVGDLIPLEIVPWVRICLQEQPKDTVWRIATKEVGNGYSYVLTNSWMYDKRKRLVVTDKKVYGNEEVLFLFKPTKE